MALGRNFDYMDITPFDLVQVSLRLESFPISDYLRVVIAKPNGSMEGWLSELHITHNYKITTSSSDSVTPFTRWINIEQLGLYEIEEEWVHKNGVVVERNVTKKIALNSYQNPLPPNIEFVNGRAERLEVTPMPLDKLLRIIGYQFYSARMNYVAPYILGVSSRLNADSF